MDKEKWQSWGKNEPWHADYTRLLQVEGRVASEHVEMLWELTVTQWLRKLLRYSEFCKG